VESVDEDWISGVNDLKSVARFCQPASLVMDILDEKSLDVCSVHLVITAEELTDGASQMEVVEERDRVPPLHALHLREP